MASPTADDSVPSYLEAPVGIHGHLFPEETFQHLNLCILYIVSTIKF